MNESYGGDRNAYVSSVGKGKRQLGRPRKRWQGIINMENGDIGHENGRCMDEIGSWPLVVFAVAVLQLRFLLPRS